MDFVELAVIGHAAVRQHLIDARQLDACETRDWEDLPEIYQLAWEEGARAIITHLEETGVINYD